MTEPDKNLPLFVLLAKKDELPKEKLASEKESSVNRSGSASKSSPTDIRYSLYKHISTFG